MERDVKGFTLIELMIVVAIIGILAAIAIPNFINFKRRAILSAALANLEEARLALAQYAASEDDWCYPPSTNDYNVFRSMLHPYGLQLPDSPSGIQWAAFEGYERGSCTQYTITILAADNQTKFKALPKGSCCVDGPHCARYAGNVPLCSEDFGL